MEKQTNLSHRAKKSIASTDAVPLASADCWDAGILLQTKTVKIKNQLRQAKKKVSYGSSGTDNVKIKKQLRQAKKKVSYGGSGTDNVKIKKQLQQTKKKVSYGGSGTDDV